MTAREAPGMSLDELETRSEKSWTVFGPCSGGVRVVHLCDGLLYTYSGGDARDDGSCGIVVESIREYAAGGGDIYVVDWLRDAGRL